MALASGAFNRVLADEPWARDRLAAHAGRAFALRVGPLKSEFRIDGHGALEAAPAVGTTPDLVVTLSPFTVPAFLANPARWSEFVTEEGDVELGGTLKELAQTLPWFVEKLCARTLGPIVGQRVADAGRRMLELPEYATKRIGANVGSYARDEVEVLAHPMDMQSLRDEAAALDTRIDALTARIDALAAHLPEKRSDTA
jgi:ubiquinone biosynthesis protein UbiJ